MSAFNLVNVDADTAQKLSEYITALLTGASSDAAPSSSSSSAFAAECTRLIPLTQSDDKSVSAPAVTALATLFLDHNQAVLATDVDADIEGYFQAIASLTLLQSDASSGGSLQENLPIVQKAVAALTARTDSKPKLRLRILVALFNMSCSGQAKHFVLSSLMGYATATGLTAQVLPHHTR